eukprot:scaffold13.g271.t1
MAKWLNRFKSAKDLRSIESESGSPSSAKTRGKGQLQSDERPEAFVIKAVATSPGQQALGPLSGHPLLGPPPSYEATSSFTTPPGVGPAAPAPEHPDGSPLSPPRPIGPAGAPGAPHPRVVRIAARTGGVWQSTGAAELELPVYRSLSQFRQRMELYRGAVSTVHKATCVATDTEVILKQYFKHHMSEWDLRKMRREIKLLYELQHECGVARILGDFADAAHHYIVQASGHTQACGVLQCKPPAPHGDEFYVGRDLYHRMIESSVLEEPWACTKIVAPLLRTLDRLHSEHAVVHRDIKPENLFLSRQGRLGWGDDELKLGDFGLAIRLSEELPFLRAGTLDFMAPEARAWGGCWGCWGCWGCCVLANRVVEMDEGPEVTHEHLREMYLSAYGEKADVWAVGVLAYEMLMSETPFYHESETETVKLIMESSYIRFPRRLATSNWAAFVRAALTKDPEARPSAAALLRHPWIQQHVRKAPMTRHQSMPLKLAVGRPSFARAAQAFNSRASYKAKGIGGHRIPASPSAPLLFAASPAAPAAMSLDGSRSSGSAGSSDGMAPSSVASRAESEGTVSYRAATPGGDAARAAAAVAALAQRYTAMSVDCVTPARGSNSPTSQEQAAPPAAPPPPPPIAPVVPWGGGSPPALAPPPARWFPPRPAAAPPLRSASLPPLRPAPGTLPRGSVTAEELEPALALLAAHVGQGGGRSRKALSLPPMTSLLRGPQRLALAACEPPPDLGEAHTAFGRGGPVPRPPTARQRKPSRLGMSSAMGLAQAAQVAMAQEVAAAATSSPATPTGQQQQQQGVQWAPLGSRLEPDFEPGQQGRHSGPASSKATHGTAARTKAYMSRQGGGFAPKDGSGEGPGLRRHQRGRSLSMGAPLPPGSQPLLRGSSGLEL